GAWHSKPGGSHSRSLASNLT
ncbi:hypothetical protein D046_2762B, partial [Vibrio parahaemolyticus V-223/04]